MKIRNGFVSNSSTSSFMIYGLKLGKDMIQALIKKNIKDAEFTYTEEIEKRKAGCKCYHNPMSNFCTKCGKKVIITTIENECSIDLDDFSDDLKKVIGISVQSSYFNKEIGYIGKIIQGNSELEDLIKTKEMLAKMFPDNKCQFHTEISNN